SHTLTARSRLAAASQRPSGDRASRVTVRSNPANVCRRCHVPASHRWTSPALSRSPDPVASVPPSRAMARLPTPPPSPATNPRHDLVAPLARRGAHKPHARFAVASDREGSSVRKIRQRHRAGLVQADGETLLACQVPDEHRSAQALARRVVAPPGSGGKRLTV